MTNIPTAIGGCWPTPTQELLLRAALNSGENALRPWKEWQALVDVEHLDDGSFRLLPLLWRNLEAQGVDKAELKRYISVGRHSWVQNQILLKQATRLIDDLQSAGIPVVVLKGAALIFLYYKDVATRPMNDFDLLVPRSEAVRAFQLLIDQGYELNEWKNPPQLTERSLSVFHDSVFRKAGETQFDVHQHVFSHSFILDAKESWDAAIPLQIGDVSTRALCPEDAFLHVCAHGVRWDDVPPLRWVADAAMILRATPDFNWNRLVEQSRRHSLSIPMRQAVKYLQRLDLEVSIPDAALRELGRIPTSRAERREWSALSRPASSYSIAFKLWYRTRCYARWNTTNPRWKRPFTFPRYLQFFWGLDSLLQLPTHGFSRLIHHLKR